VVTCDAKPLMLFAGRGTWDEYFLRYVAGMTTDTSTASLLPEDIHLSIPDVLVEFSQFLERARTFTSECSRVAFWIRLQEDSKCEYALVSLVRSCSSFSSCICINRREERRLYPLHVVHYFFTSVSCLLRSKMPRGKRSNSGVYMRCATR